MITWENVPGQTSIEFDDERAVPLKLALYARKHNLFPQVELVIYWYSSGYNEPMSMYEGPDNLGWPAEGSEDRELNYAELDGHRLPTELAESLFEEYRTEVDETELESI